ncbi:MAG: TonB family protein [Desulfuromonadaceae bacterium]|nr:TonB family protein [Desulfuromonadaceae bacterium]MDD2847986.1 TonB family protein [Desulfuromonadaceae bacterium]MDD4131272.1 TonB family protein [Desulfuromonadaceae bacterium]
MPDRYIEKTFIYLLALSLLLHIGVIAALYYYPASPQTAPKEPVFIDLQQMPETKQPVEQHQQVTKRRSEQRVRVTKESAPRGNAPQDFQAVEKQTAPTQSSPAATAPGASRTAAEQPPVTPGSSTASLLKPKTRATPQQQTAVPNLFPGARRLARLEDSYRRKFENDIAEGDTRFLNSDDIVFGSFLRRFEGAIYGVWRYPQEAAMKGIEGITPVRITFNRRGEITNIVQLESSGARILDEEVLRTLRAIGPVGGFPKGYNKEEFHLIAFFQYGGSRRSLR